MSHGINGSIPNTATFTTDSAAIHHAPPAQQQYKPQPAPFIHLSARCVIVLGSGSLESSNLADRIVLSIVLGVQALEPDDNVTTHAKEGEEVTASPIVAELRRPEHVRTCRMLGGGSAQGKSKLAFHSSST